VLAEYGLEEARTSYPPPLARRRPMNFPARRASYWLDRPHRKRSRCRQRRFASWVNFLDQARALVDGASTSCWSRPARTPQRKGGALAIGRLTRLWPRYPVMVQAPSNPWGMLAGQPQRLLLSLPADLLSVGLNARPVPSS
jgi:hypothetical protein